MAKKEKSAPSWSEVKNAIEAHGRDELVKLVGDLYQFSKANKDFILSRLSIGGDPLNPYKKVIQASISPDGYERPVQVALARTAISDYKKAVGDLLGEIELMMFFVEQGMAFTVEYGDVNAAYPDALESIYGRAVNNVKKLPENSQIPFKKRLKDIITAAREGYVGYCYPDNLSRLFRKAFGAGK